MAVLAMLSILLGAGEALAKSDEAIRRNNFGAELLKQGRVEEAIGEFRRALELDPGYTAARLNLAYAYERGDRIDEAISEYKKALEQEPKNVLGQNNLGVLYDKKGLYDQAVAAFEQALRVDPSNATIQANLESARKNMAVVQEREARIAEARKQVEAKPKDPRAAYGLARVYASFDRKEPAFEWLARALALGFDDLDFVRNDPVLSGLRADPRFQRLLNRK